MKVITWETLYYEDHGATFEAQVWKKDSSIIPSLFSLIFFVGPSPSYFFMASFSLFYFFFYFSPESHPDLWGNHSLHHPFLTWDNALIMKIITLLFTYNSRITTRYLEQNMTLCEYLRRCIGIAMNQEWHVWKIKHGGFATNTMSTTWSCKAIWQWWSVS